MNYLAGKVNSPIPIPSYYPSDIVSGTGAYVINKDGQRYIDLWMGYGALLFGHADIEIVDAVKNEIEKGWFFSYQTSLEKELSGIINSIIPSAETVRFATTGSDAAAYAIRLSRAQTNRKKVLSIIGGYHGVHENMIPSKGILDNDFLNLVPFNNIEAIEEKLVNNDYACLVMEPILANSGCTPPESDYLKKIRDICTKTGTILVFDEVVTGFRVDLGGAQKLFNVIPDISVFSKAIASGFPLSVICGKKEILENFIPSGQVFFAGTFNASPISLVVAKVVINKLKNSNFYQTNIELGDNLMRYISDQILELGLLASVQGVASMLTIAFGCKTFNSGVVLENINISAYNSFISKMAKRNILLPPLHTETIFLSPVHSAVLDDIKKAIRESLQEIKNEYY